MVSPLVTGALTNPVLNETLTKGFSVLSNTSTAAFIMEYGKQLPTLAAGGDFFALLIAFILGFFLLVIINKLTGVILGLVRYTFVFIITGFGIVYFYIEFRKRASLGLTTETMIFGSLGIIVGIFGLGFAIYSLVRRIRETPTPWPKPTLDQISTKGFEQEKTLPELELEEEAKGMGLRDMFSWESVKADKSLLSVLAFMVVAQFGVFSSKTIAAPNIKTGVILFTAFFVAAFFFIRQSYKKYSTGVMHLVFTLVVGFVLSILVGAAWNEIQIQQLLSISYFKTDSLIALISGMALSLFAGSKN